MSGATALREAATEIATKRCSTCGGTFPLEQMTKDRKAKDGRMGRCKRCSSEVSRRWQQRNPERAAAINRASKERNRERAKEQRKARNARLKDDEAHQRTLRDRRIQRIYNVTQEWFEAQLAAQGGRCAICAVPQAEVGRAFSIDHDHNCCSGTKSCGECVRGLLCGPCNLAIAAMDNAPDWLTSAVNYIEAHR